MDTNPRLKYDSTKDYPAAQSTSEAISIPERVRSPRIAWRPAPDGLLCARGLTPGPIRQILRRSKQKGHASTLLCGLKHLVNYASPHRHFFEQLREFRNLRRAEEAFHPTSMALVPPTVSREAR